MLRPFQFTSSARLNFQPGGVQRLGDEIKNLGGRKALVVTDRGVRKSGLLEKPIESLTQAGIPYIIFSEVEPNPSGETVQKGFELLKQEECDILVAIGGGSSIDAAKAVGVLATNPAPLMQYEGANKIPNPPPPLLAIPTTAGTGSEVTGAAVITDKARKYKCSIRSPLLIPKVALLDPEVLCTLPPPVLAATGMDAFTHAYEAFVSTLTNPVSQGLAYDSMRTIGNNLRRFYANPDNGEAAGYMLLASTMAGMAFYNGRVGIVHAMAHPLGGFFDIPHGLANAILLPHCMEFSRLAVPELFGRIAEALGAGMGGAGDDEASKRAVPAVREMMADLHIPKGLKEVGAKKEAFEAMAKDAVASGIHLTTPRKTTQEDMVNLYQAAYE
jgi:alcohol dehydrogenase class IV